MGRTVMTYKHSRLPFSPCFNGFQILDYTILGTGANLSKLLCWRYVT